MLYVTLFLNLLPVVLKNIPGISAAMTQIINDVGASISAIFASGVVTQPTVSGALAAWLGVINALAADPNIPKNYLGPLAQLEKAVQAALLQDTAAAKLVDWNAINPIAPVS